MECVQGDSIAPAIPEALAQTVLAFLPVLDELFLLCVVQQLADAIANSAW